MSSGKLGRGTSAPRDETVSQHNLRSNLDPETLTATRDPSERGEAAHSRPLQQRDFGAVLPRVAYIHTYTHGPRLTKEQLSCLQYINVTLTIQDFKNSTYREKVSRTPWKVCIIKLILLADVIHESRSPRGRQWQDRLKGSRYCIIHTASNTTSEILYNVKSSVILGKLHTCVLPCMKQLNNRYLFHLHLSHRKNMLWWTMSSSVCECIVIIWLLDFYTPICI